MPKLSPIQTSFSSGEQSSRMLSRIETKGYREGCRHLRNMVPLAQGPAQRRVGTRFAYELPPGVEDARVISMVVADDNFFVLVFYDLKLQILDKFGAPISPEFLLNSKFNQFGTSWIVVTGGSSTVAFSGISATLTSANVANLARIRQSVTSLIPGSVYTLKVLQVSPNDSLRLRVGTTAGGFETAATTGNSAIVSVVFTATATTHWFEVANLTIGVAGVLSEVSVTEAAGALAAFTSPYSADVLRTIQFEQSPDSSRMYFVQGTVPVYELLWADPLTFTFAAAAIVAPPAEWVTNNYPKTIAFSQGRLWLGGTRVQPSQFWGSKSGSYLDFTLGTNADDAVSYTIAKRGGIRWMSGAKSLLIGTDTQEYVVSSDTGVITPESITLEPQSAYGSSQLQVAQIGNLVIYVSNNGRKVYSMGYRFEESGWVSTDLSFAAEHITEERIVAMAFAQYSENTLWCIGGAGLLFGVNYDRGNNIIGWHRHPAQLQFRSVSVARFLGADVTFFSYRIERASAIVVQVGVIANVIANVGAVYTDSHKRTTVASPATVFPGYQHLAGKTVQVVGDGAVQPSVVVAADGTLTIQDAVTEVVAGLGYIPLLATMPFEPGQPPQGTSASFKRFNAAYVQVLSSARPLINGQRAADRTPKSPMNLREPGETERLYSVNLGWNLEEIITVSEDLPVELTVSGIFGELGVEDL